MTPEQWTAVISAIWAVVVTALAAVNAVQDGRRVRQLERQLFTAQGVIAERGDAMREQEDLTKSIGKQRDNLIVENVRLRLRAEGICGDQPEPLFGDASTVACVLRRGHASEWHEAEPGSPGMTPMRWKKNAARDRLPQLWTCPVEGHTKVEWRGNVGFCAGYGCHHNSLEPVVDEDVSRPYIPDYGVPALNDPTVDPDAWKGELR